MKFISKMKLQLPFASVAAVVFLLLLLNENKIQMFYDRVEWKEKENDGDAETDDIESCLRPRSNSAALVKPRPPCELNRFSDYGAWSSLPNVPHH